MWFWFVLFMYIQKPNCHKVYVLYDRAELDGTSTGESHMNCINSYYFHNKPVTEKEYQELINGD